ncbi:MAG TPA: CHRD domain-containing protein [Rhizomicrobium sp.]|nr:CHRD domain-containing protein [Rhizomicrobium sp.]
MGRFLLALPLLAVAIFCAAFGAPAFAADNYQTDIGPTPLDAAAKVTVQGRGSVTATLDGNKFSLQGTFSGLVTPATDAHLCMGIVMGGQGPVIYDLQVSQAQSGSVSGAFMLTPAQVTALKAGKLYVQVNSQKAPPPRGNLWGWFQPAHETVAPDVPEEGHWYVPNLLDDSGRVG